MLRGRALTTRHHRRPHAGQGPPAEAARKRPGRVPARLFYGALLAAAAAGVGVWLLTTTTESPPDVERLLPAAVAAAMQGDPEAARLLDQILQLDSGNEQALLLRGQVAHAAGHVQDALDWWSRIPQASPHSSSARCAEGVALVSLGDAERGEAALREAARQKANYLPPRERLVELYVMQLRPADIRQQLDEIVQLRPWRPEELGLYAVASERLSEVELGIRRLRPLNGSASQFALARLLRDDGQYDEAAEVAQRLLSRQPGDSRLLALIAEIRLRQDRLPAAAAVLRRPLADTDPDSRYWRSRGQYWMEQRDWRRAADCLAQAVLGNPEDLAACHQLGTALRRLGRHQDAAFHLGRAKLLDRVLRQASRIPNSDRRDPRAVLGIMLDVADALAQLHRHDEAAQWFRHALLMQPDNAAARRRLDESLAAARGGPTVRSLLLAHLPVSARGETPRALAGLLERCRPAAADASQDAEDLVRSPKPPREPGPIRLRDVHAESGLKFQYFNGQSGSKYLVESMGGGVGVLDYDSDGWPDLYLVQGGTLPQPQGELWRDRLLRNQGNGRFQDVTERAGLGHVGYGQGCAVGDYDNDGAPDLLVTNLGRNVLYRNNGDGTFTDRTEQAGISGLQWSSSAAFADLDGDGLLDLYVVNYVQDPFRVCRGDNGRIAACDPQNYRAEQDQLYRNVGDGRFEDVTDSSGIRKAGGKGLGLVTADLDNDRRPDIYVANDGTPNFLFRNTSQPGRLSFEEIGLLAGAAVNGAGRAEGGMGIACADFQHDGLLDLLVTNFSDETNTLYRNLGDMLFDDSTPASGMTAPTGPMVGFGTQAADFDRDGQLDLFVTKGHIDDFRFRHQRWRMPAQLFRGLGQLRFEDVSADCGEFFGGEHIGRGAARLDWDPDGDVDILVVHQDAPAALLSNETPQPGHGVVVELHGVASNRDAIGARLTVEAGGTVQHLEVTGGDGYYCSNERRQFIGLGAAEQVAALEVRWPSGRVDTHHWLPADCRLVLVEGAPPRVAPIAAR